FKIAADDNAKGALGTDAVDMVFTTERPFFPYREPSDQRDATAAKDPGPPPARRLRIFFMGPGRFEGELGENPAKTRWPGKAIWSNRFDEAEGLPFPIMPGTWLTAFDDESSPRPGVEELYFARAAERTPLKPPAVHYTVTDHSILPL